MSFCLFVELNRKFLFDFVKHVIRECEMGGGAPKSFSESIHIILAKFSQISNACKITRDNLEAAEPP